MKKLALLASLCGLLLLTSCSSIQFNWTRFSANVTNKPATVECYSGGELIFESKTANKPLSEPNSDGYFFQDANSGKFMEVNADCIFTYDP